MARPAQPVEHGTTYRMAQRCGRRGGGRCDLCKSIASEYMAVWRKRPPECMPTDADLAEARGRAAYRIARMHPALFRALVAEELDRARLSRREVA